MTGPGDRDERMDALEARVRRVEQDANAARVLAGGADRDVADLGREVREFRAEFRGFRDRNNRVLNAMRADLTDLRSHVDEQFARVDERFGRVDEQFAQVDRNFVGIRGVLDAQAAGQQQIIALLEAVARGEGGDGPRR